MCAGLPLGIGSGASARSPVQAWHFFLGMFGAVGVGALASDADIALRLVLGGGFVLAGVGSALLLRRVQEREDAILRSLRQNAVDPPERVERQ